ncbi:tyrosine-type recombinase/integrase [Alcaligenes nematophilus]|uniref:Site-specific integrase n=2 Tax=Alcaligenes TaxID=507 RepID=A0A3G2HXV1_9BURK|nr:MULTISPECIES: tyrosine-type recombinase/integrase [Alcaligenes]AYN21992.1 site-specific integrase [Alcaligenes aquatilis]MCX5565788.1 tyrosine-type recombinase/integrase [Alcaligenes phenolicus]
MSGTQAFEVRNLVFASGERFPVLIDGETGVPDFEVTLYVLTQLRSRNLSASTLTVATRSVMFGSQVLGYMGVDLRNRINQGKLLDLAEFDQLVDSFFWTQEKLRQALSQPTRESAPNRVLSLESVRKSRPVVDSSQIINADTAATRLLYFRDFLKWKVERSLFALATTHENYQRLNSAKEFMVDAINARMPKGSSKNDLDARQGLSSEETALLLESVKLNSDQNPWKPEFIRVRNRLIVHLLLNLGLRKGELLGIKVGDMNLEKNELTIHRRADDVEDPRSIQPNAKTNARILYVDQELASALHAYVVKFRQTVGGAWMPSC